MSAVTLGASLGALVPAGGAEPAPVETRRAGLVGAWNGGSWLEAQMAAGLPLQNWGSDDWGATVDAGIAVAAVDRAFGTSHVVLAELWAAVVAHREAIVVVKGADDAGRLAKVILLAHALGEDPHAVGTGAGADLVQRLLDTRHTTGADTGLFGQGAPDFDGAFRQGLALRALQVAGATVPASAVDWLLAQQCADGSWMAHRADLTTPCVADAANFTGPDTNSTGAALDALTMLAPPTSPVDWRKGAEWLGTVANDDGGWGYFPGDPTDANSTAVALASLTAPGDTSAHGAGAPALLALQVPCDAEAGGGAFGFLDNSAADLLATTQAVAALALDGGLAAADAPAADAGLGTPAVACTDVASAVTTTTTTTTTAPTAAAVASTAAASSSVPPASVAAATTSAAAATGAASAAAGSSGSAIPLAVTGGGVGLAPAGLLAVGLGLILSVLARVSARRAVPVPAPVGRSRGKGRA